MMARLVQAQSISQRGCRVPADPAMGGKLGKPTDIAQGWPTGNLDEGIGWKVCLLTAVG